MSTALCCTIGLEYSIVVEVLNFNSMIYRCIQKTILSRDDLSAYLALTQSMFLEMFF